jgi:hypothetical protein
LILTKVETVISISVDDPAPVYLPRPIYYFAASPKRCLSIKSKQRISRFRFIHLYKNKLLVSREV